jgi:hypothetical protein
MRNLKLLLLTFVSLVAAQSVLAMARNSKIEMHPYAVLKSYKGFEIRKYSAANFSYVKLNSNRYSEVSNKGFRKLAGYIFGGNEKGQQISMTSPVEMELDKQMTMKFLIPAEYAIEDLPKPNDPDVKFVHEPEKIVAAIKFGGYANDRKIEYHKKLLKKALSQYAIQHTGEFSFLGYNSPFDFWNRRNEIIVEVIV